LHDYQGSCLLGHDFVKFDPLVPTFKKHPFRSSSRLHQPPHVREVVNSSPPSFLAGSVLVEFFFMPPFCLFFGRPFSPWCCHPPARFVLFRDGAPTRKIFYSSFSFACAAKLSVLVLSLPSLSIFFFVGGASPVHLNGLPNTSDRQHDPCTLGTWDVPPFPFFEPFVFPAPVFFPGATTSVFPTFNKVSFSVVLLFLIFFLPLFPRRVSLELPLLSDPSLSALPPGHRFLCEILTRHFLRPTSRS